MFKKIIAVLIVPFVASIAIMPFAFDTNIETSHFSIISNKISNQVKIAVIADLHSCDYGDKQKELIDIINKEKPDAIVLVGDIVDDVIPQQKAIEFFEGIKNYPTFYVSGNHEFWSNDIKGIKKTIANYGTNVLAGECVDSKLNGNNIKVCGVDDIEVGTGEFNEQLRQIENHKKEKFGILLGHRPEYINDYLATKNDIIISGHAHGGQWRIPFILENGLFAPGQGFFPKYTNGVHNFGWQYFVISRGLSKESSRIPRIFNRPEIVFISLVNG